MIFTNLTLKNLYVNLFYFQTIIHTYSVRNRHYKQIVREITVQNLINHDFQTRKTYPICILINSNKKHTQKSDILQMHFTCKLNVFHNEQFDKQSTKVTNQLKQMSECDLFLINKFLCSIDIIAVKSSKVHGHSNELATIQFTSQFTDSISKVFCVIQKYKLDNISLVSLGYYIDKHLKKDCKTKVSLNVEIKPKKKAIDDEPDNSNHIMKRIVAIDENNTQGSLDLNKRQLAEIQELLENNVSESDAQIFNTFLNEFVFDSQIDEVECNIKYGDVLYKLKLPNKQAIAFQRKQRSLSMNAPMFSPLQQKSIVHVEFIDLSISEQGSQKYNVRREIAQDNSIATGDRIFRDLSDPDLQQKPKKKQKEKKTQLMLKYKTHATKENQLIVISQENNNIPKPEEAQLIKPPKVLPTTPKKSNKLQNDGQSGFNSASTADKTPPDNANPKPFVRSQNELNNQSDKDNPKARIDNQGSNNNKLKKIGYIYIPFVICGIIGFIFIYAVSTPTPDMKGSKKLTKTPIKQKIRTQITVGNK